MYIYPNEEQQCEPKTLRLAGNSGDIISYPFYVCSEECFYNDFCNKMKDSEKKLKDYIHQLLQN